MVFPVVVFSALIEVGGPIVNYDIPPNRVVGYTFSVSEALDITALGFYDANQDGLGVAHTVAIYSFGVSDALVTAEVPAGTGGTLDNYFRFVPIAPVQLGAGETYVIVATWPYGAGDPFVWYPPSGWGVTSITVDPRITLLGGAYSDDTSNLEYPDNFVSGVHYFGPSMQSGATVPEPGTWVLALAGFGLLAARRFRSR